MKTKRFLPNRLKRNVQSIHISFASGLLSVGGWLSFILSNARKRSARFCLPFLRSMILLFLLWNQNIDLIVGGQTQRASEVKCFGLLLRNLAIKSNVKLYFLWLCELDHLTRSGHLETKILSIVRELMRVTAVSSIFQVLSLVIILW